MNTDSSGPCLIQTNSTATLRVNYFLALPSFLSGIFCMCLNKIFVKLIPDFSSLGIIHCLCPMGEKDRSLILPLLQYRYFSLLIYLSGNNFGLNSYSVLIFLQLFKIYP